MASDQWYEQLEAYLDGELDRAATAEFEAETANDRELTAILHDRRGFRDTAREALTSDLPPDLTELARGLGRRPLQPDNPRRDHRWTMVALAAVLTLALLAPRLLRNQNGAVGPRSTTITTGGPVIALRFGETPDAVVDLEAGCYHLTTGICR